MTPVFSITTNAPAQNGGPLWFPFTPDLPTINTMDQLADELSKEGFVSGHTWREAKHAPTGKQYLDDPTPCVLFSSSVVHIKKYKGGRPPLFRSDL